MIWAESETGLIGNEGHLPWHLPEDLAHFKWTTEGCPIIVGRKTYESLPKLHGRIPITVTRDPLYFPFNGGLTAPTLTHALDAARMFRSDWVWIIGGGEIFQEAIKQDIADLAIITTVRRTDGTDFQGDAYAPDNVGEATGWKVKTFKPHDGGWFPSRVQSLEWRITEMERKRG